MGIHSAKNFRPEKRSAVRRQPMDWERIFRNCASDLELRSKFIRNSNNLIAKPQLILLRMCKRPH
jgi:hypothetical protein